MLAVGLVGCGDETPPDPSSLSLRQYLGLAPERAAELPIDQREAIAARLLEAWRLEPTQADTLPLTQETSLLEAIRVIDQRRAETDQDVLLGARLDLGPDAATLLSGLADPLSLGLSLQGRLLLDDDDLDPRSPIYQGPLAFDEAWGRADIEALDGRSELDVIEAIEPALRRFLASAGVRSELLIARAPRAPLLLWYAHERAALLVNPNLLLLIGLPQDPLATRRWRLTPDFVSSCAEDHRARCDACLESDAACSPLFDGGDDPVNAARDECAQFALRDGEGFELFCYHQSIRQTLTCFSDADPQDACGASGVPHDRVDALSSLSPMLTSETCQDLLVECHDAPTSVDGTPVTSTPQVRNDDDDDSGLGSFLDGCSGCDGLDGCDGFDGCGDSGCDGDGLDGAGSACGGDQSGDDDDGQSLDDVWGDREVDGASLPWPTTLPFALLLPLWWRERSRRDDP